MSQNLTVDTLIRVALQNRILPMFWMDHSATLHSRQEPYEKLRVVSLQNQETLEASRTVLCPQYGFLFGYVLLNPLIVLRWWHKQSAQTLFLLLVLGYIQFSDWLTSCLNTGIRSCWIASTKYVPFTKASLVIKFRIDILLIYVDKNWNNKICQMK